MLKKNKVSRHPLSDFETSSNATVLKTLWSGVRTNMERNGTHQSPEIDPHIHIHLIFNKGKETKMGNNNPVNK